MECRGCGESGPSTFFDDPVSGDTLCTQCGLVANRDTSLVVGFHNMDHLQDEMMPPVPCVVRRVVNQLRLEPFAQWARGVVEQQNKNGGGGRLTVERVCEIILKDLTPPEQRTPLFRHRIEPLLTKQKKTALFLATEALLLGGEAKTTSSEYDGLLKDLSAYAPELDRRAIVGMRRACEDVVERHPGLQMVLPASVVIATYIQQFHIKAPKTHRQRTIQSLCEVLGLKPCSVNKVLKTISNNN